MDERLIVALDTADRDRALHLVELLRPVIRIWKIGLQLFTAHGPAIVHDLAAAGADVFIDLKLHDIPNTVKGAISSLRALPAVRFLTLHAAGGRAMLEAAVEAARRERSDRPALLAVTVLTSLDVNDLQEAGILATPAAQVRRLALLARTCGVDGLVCSPHEVAEIRQITGPDFILVTPGVRPAGSDRGDQQRIATPAAALQAGATHLVVGRPITAAKAPLDAARQLLDSLP